jgi:hypothetical protein
LLSYGLFARQMIRELEAQVIEERRDFHPSFYDCSSSTFRPMSLALCIHPRFTRPSHHAHAPPSMKPRLSITHPCYSSLARRLASKMSRTVFATLQRRQFCARQVFPPNCYTLPGVRIEAEIYDHGGSGQPRQQSASCAQASEKARQCAQPKSFHVHSARPIGKRCDAIS